MSLRDEYLKHKDERNHIPFDYAGDDEFCKKQMGLNLGEFCQKIFKELMEIEARLDELERN